MWINLLKVHHGRVTKERKEKNKIKKKERKKTETKNEAMRESGRKTIEREGKRDERDHLGKRVLGLGFVLATFHGGELDERRRSMDSVPERLGRTKRDGVRHRRAEKSVKRKREERKESQHSRSEE